MMHRKLLVANRGEIAIRVLRAARELGMSTLAVYSEDDARSQRRRRADASYALKGRGLAAYLDIQQLVAAASQQGCDAIHPGYGFFSESAAFAQACADAGLTFVGPKPETLRLLGDKTRARELGVPVLPGNTGPASLEEAAKFIDAMPKAGALVIKASFGGGGGGGGRGMRVVRKRQNLAEAYERCRSEALHSATTRSTASSSSSAHATWRCWCSQTATAP